ncbi:secretory lipase-domain-containing protein [Aspergillus cavernicola]|uniref:Secretory lipase-domain-containing protein n=1 Tax=Aspergillus cavernicola TaxID=176166 RepID=A0ABR4I4W0_9EURO
MATLLFQLLFFLVPLLASALPAVTERDGPLTPGEDPFYQPPAGWESTAPGAILRHRTPPFPVAAFGLAKVNLDASHQILYRTTDSFGEPITTVTTVLIPHNADYTKVLSYQVAQDAADPNCSPSFAIQQFSDAGEALALIMPQLEYLFMSSALNKGWVVIIPDHLGPRSAFLANNLSGQAVLDNIRAALASTKFTKISPQATVTMWGYSGGSLASGFAAELQPSYAPELKIAGAALGGTVPQILPVIEASNKGIFTGLLPAGVQGLANEYPSAQGLIRDNIVPDRWADFNKTQELCLTGNLIEYLGQDIYTYVKSEDTFTGPVATKLLSENAMGQNTPQIPLFIYKAVNDEISPVNDTDDLYNTYCSNGASVEYVRDLLSEHALLTITGGPDAFMWLADRMSGVPVKKGCTRNTQLTGLADPRAILALGLDVVRLLLGFLLFPVGPIGR